MKRKNLSSFKVRDGFLLYKRKNGKCKMKKDNRSPSVSLQGAPEERKLIIDSYQESCCCRE